MARLNLCLGAKGSIGKSFIAALMAQYMTDNFIDKSPLCIDLDFKTQTFKKYRGLDVSLIDVETDGEIERGKFDVEEFQKMKRYLTWMAGVAGGLLLSAALMAWLL